MDFTGLIEMVGDDGVAAIGGLIVGLAFGIFAQRSQFCLRSATIEFWRGTIGPKTTLWLLTFGAALFGAQLLINLGTVDTASIRQLSTVGTLSGAVIGGVLFGSGMILARGCASRLLVLSATGNLRALISGLILTVVAQASLRGVLSPLRIEFSSLWVIDPNQRNLMASMPSGAGVLIGIGVLLTAVFLAFHRRLSFWTVVGGVAVGATIVGGWWFTSALSAQAFDIVPVQSVSFTGPSADTLMALMNQPSVSIDFGLGLVPGVFVGSFIAAVTARDFRFETFDSEVGVPRYILGASLMGFGGMLAGGCAVGAGVTGGSVFALTAWVALTAMWISAGLTDFLVDRRL